MTATSSSLIAGATVVDTFGFTTSSTGALSAGEKIVLSDAAVANTFLGTTIATVSVNGIAPTAAVVAVGAPATLTITLGANITASTAVTILVSALTQRPAGLQSITATTTADGTASSAATFTTVTGTAVTGTALTTSSTAVGGSSNYTVTFTATTALTSGVSTITLAAPFSTVFPANTGSNYVVNSVVAGTVSGAGTATAVITVPTGVLAGGLVTVTIQGVKNALYNLGTHYTLSANTSQDVTPVATALFGFGTAITGLTGPVPNTAAAGAAADDTFSFVATSGLVAAGAVNIAQPISGAWSGVAGSYSINGVAVAAVAGCGGLTPTGTVCEALTVPAGVAVGAGGTVTVQALLATNPSTSGTYTDQVSTGVDTAFVTTGSYTIATVVTAGTPTLVPAGFTAGQTTTVTATFTTSTNGALGAGTGTITLTVPSSTMVFPAGTTNYLVNSVIAPAVSPSGNTVTITVPAAIGISTPVTVTVNNVIDPSAGTYRGSISTSADTIGAPANAAFVIVAPPVSTVSAVAPATGPTVGGTAVTITGTNFVSGATVRFGTMAATGVTVASGTSITATSPANYTGALDVTVTTSGGTSATSASDLFTYTASYNSLAAPVRVFDSRTGNPSGLATPFSATAGQHLVAGTPMAVQVAGASPYPVPASAAAVLLNVTIVNPAAGGYLTVFPTGVTMPTASNINFGTGQTVPNLVEVALGSGGNISLYSAAATDAIVDVEGYVGATGGSLYGSVAPVRVFDSRTGNPSNLSAPFNVGSGHTLVPNTPQLVTVAGTGYPAPTGTTAVVANITVTNTSGPGYVSTYAGGGTAPTASNVNFVAGQTTSNRVIVPVNAVTGQISLIASTGTDVIVDINGFYNATGGTGTQQPSVESAPSRLVDTRAGNPSGLSGALSALYTGKTIAAGGSLTVQVTGYANVPATAKSVVLNLTTTNISSGSDYVTVYPTGGTLPTTSDINPTAGSTQANLVVAQLGVGVNAGQITIYNNSGTADVIVDILGWNS